MKTTKTATTLGLGTPRTKPLVSIACTVAAEAALLLSLRVAAEPVAPLFRPLVDYPTGAGTQSIAIADINRDGIPDVVAGNVDDDTVSVLLGKGAVPGALRPRVDYPTGDTPREVAVDDLNRDGIPDIVTANKIWTVSVLLGKSAGGFQPHIDYPTGNFSYPESVKLVDLNRDGRLDVVTANTANSVSVLLGNGDGTLRPHVNYLAGTSQFSVQGMAVGDLNRDAATDIVTADGFDNSLSILFGKYNGTLRPRVIYHLPSFVTSVGVGDLNHDGKADLVSINVALGSSTGTLTVWMGPGNGVFKAVGAYAVGGSGPLVITDLNVDGHPDIVIASLSVTRTVVVLLGRGDGTFLEADYFGGISLYSLAVADLSRGGRPDIATARENFVGVLLGFSEPQ